MPVRVVRLRELEPGLRFDTRRPASGTRDVPPVTLSVARHAAATRRSSPQQRRQSDPHHDPATLQDPASSGGCASCCAQQLEVAGFAGGPKDSVPMITAYPGDLPADLLGGSS